MIFSEGWKHIEQDHWLYEQKVIQNRQDTVYSFSIHPGFFVNIARIYDINIKSAVRTYRIEMTVPFVHPRMLTMITC